MAHYIIVDWANNHTFKNEVFENEEDGIDFIFDNVESDEVDEFIVCDKNEHNPTPLSTLDLLEDKSYRTQL